MAECGFGAWVLWIAAVQCAPASSTSLATLVAREAAIGASEIRIYPLKHTDAQSVARVLQKVFSVRRGRRTGYAFTADVRTNSLIVTAPIDRVREVEGLIRQLDVQKPRSRVKVVRPGSQPTPRTPRPPTRPARPRPGPYVRVYPVGELLVPPTDVTPTEKALEAQVQDLCKSITPVVQKADPDRPRETTVSGVRHLRALIINGSERAHRKAAEILAELRRHRRVQVALRLHAVVGLASKAPAKHMRYATQLATDGKPIALRLIDPREAQRVLTGLRRGGGRVQTSVWHWVPDGSAVCVRMGPSRKYVSAVEAKLVRGRLQLEPVHRILNEGLSVHCLPVCRDDRSAVRMRMTVEQTRLHKMHTSPRAAGAMRLTAPQADTIRFKTTVTIPPGRLALLTWPGPTGRATVVIVEAQPHEDVPTTLPTRILPPPVKASPKRK